MHSLLVLYPPPDDPQAFREYYEATPWRSSRACPACGLSLGLRRGGRRGALLLRYDVREGPPAA
jgi:hypothetical protein